jgi:UDP-N-acetyl-2-amino-2-deoxyglucuronate dehydrogenase
LPPRMNVYLKFMGSKLNFAIIGCGKIAPRHAAEIVKHGTLVAACDIISEKADSLSDQFGAKAYYRISDLLAVEKKIDIVSVCTPNGLHPEHSIQALKAGSHVLCEKPLCITTNDARQMVETAAACNKKLFVVKSTRYNPALAELKTIIDESKLGRLYSFQLNCFWNRPEAYYANSWRGKNFPDGGTLYTQFSHYIDAMLWLFGDMKTLSGFRKNMAHQTSVEFEDSGVVAIEMENGMLGGLNWSVNSFQENMEVSLTILAEKGSIRIGGEYMNKVEYQLPDGLKLQISEWGSANDYGFYKGSMSNHAQVYDNMLKALKDGNHPFTNAIDGLKTVAAIEKIYNSVSLS